MDRSKNSKKPSCVSNVDNELEQKEDEPVCPDEHGEKGSAMKPSKEA